MFVFSAVLIPSQLDMLWPVGRHWTYHHFTRSILVILSLLTEVSVLYTCFRGGKRSLFVTVILVFLLFAGCAQLRSSPPEPPSPFSVPHDINPLTD